MAAPNAPEHINLLWPAENALNRFSSLPGRTVTDLDLEATLRGLCLVPGVESDLRRVLFAPLSDPDVIRYRQDILADLVANPDLAAALTDLLPQIAQHERARFMTFMNQNSALHEIAWRIGQLDNYIQTVDSLCRVFATCVPDPATLQSAGLCRLRQTVDALAAEEIYQHLKRELPDLLEKVRGIASITIGINLDDYLRPVEATLLSINQERYTGASPSLLSALFGYLSDAGRHEGIGPLHSTQDALAGAGQAGLSVSDPMLVPLFRDLAQVLKRSSQPVATALHRYTQVKTRWLGTLRFQLAFYLGAARLVRQLQAVGLPMCRPAIAPADERVMTIEGIYNLNLALRHLSDDASQLDQPIVTNDITFDADGRIFVLTGPNQGGKTTFTQAVGLAQVLAQIGLFVPGRRARISPADGIYTHFPVEEKPELDAGRLGEEAQRLSHLFAQVTPHSLALLNESLSSTSPGESLYLARDVLRTLRRIGMRAIFATHLHELAAEVDRLNADTPGDSPIVSLVALIRESPAAGDGPIERTYQVMPGPPMGQSFARELASRYGISYHQLTTMLRKRGILKENGSPPPDDPQAGA